MVFDLIAVDKISGEVHIVEMFGVYFKKLFALLQFLHFLSFNKTYVFLVLGLARQLSSYLAEVIILELFSAHSIIAITLQNGGEIQFKLLKELLFGCKFLKIVIDQINDFMGG